MATISVKEEFCNAVKILPLKHKQLLTFKLGGTYSWIGGNHHTVSMSCRNRSVTLTTKKVNVEEGWKFLTQISSSSTGSALLDITASGIRRKRVNFTFLDSLDVFDEVEKNRLIHELEYLRGFVRNKSPSEYSGNYCMQAAERGLSALLNNNTDFYAVYRNTHKHKNRIGFSGKNAIDRGKAFDKKGFVAKKHVFNSFNINHTQKNLIYNATNQNNAENRYQQVQNSIVTLTTLGSSTIKRFFDSDLKGKEIGFHVYYLAVTDAFHTLLLIIDKFTNPCNPTYQIMDQHGLTSSYGLLKDLPEGIRRQTSWTFANTCFNRYRNGTTGYYNSTKLHLWKIKSIK